MELQMQLLLRRLREKQAFQLPQKIFNQCNRNRENCQTRSWKVQLAGNGHGLNGQLGLCVKGGNVGKVGAGRRWDFANNNSA